MTTKFFVSKDAKGLEWPPDNSHETTAAIDICRKLWAAFNSQPKLYVMIANLHQPSADLVLITEHGIGIVELKHYFGKMTLGTDDTWYAGKTKMQAGSENQGFKNPHQQVQRYAEDIRKRLINISGKSWLPGRKADWPLYKFQTAVCFTHPDANIDQFRDMIRRNSPLRIQPWEEFRILTHEEIPEWAAAIRFEVSKGRQENFEPNRLSPQSILSITRELLNAKEWTEIANLMPTGDPYGYLTIIDNGQRIQVMPLDQEQTLIGRNQLSCSIVIPDQYSEVSRRHCQIIRTAEGIFIEDLKSTNGTFVDGEKIQKRLLNQKKHRIVLGGSEGNKKVCILEFAIKDQNDPVIPSTEHQRFM